MAEGRKDLKRIEPKYFLKGMYIDSDIYYMRSSQPVLLCNRTVITEGKLNRLKDISGKGADIYISEESYGNLMEQYKYFSGAGQENVRKFERVRTAFANVCGDSLMKDKIELKETAKLVTALHDSLNTVDLSFILQWTSYMRSVNEYLHTHSVNVSILNGMIGRWLGLGREDEKKLVMTGLVHDIGKVRIPEEILEKPGRLTEEEFGQIKKHPVYSYEILKNSGMEDEIILGGVRSHHEKGNGSGYPDGLFLGNIPYFAKITSIADIYDAMVAERVYKSAKTPFQVLDNFYRNKFSDLDFGLVDIFLNKMANELLGKDVVLSNGRLGKIIFVEKANFAYPIVQCGREVITTSKKLECVSLCSEIG